MTQSTTSHYDWLLGRLEASVGKDIARGMLDGGLATLGRTPGTATEADFRQLLRGVLRERLGMNLGKREAIAWVERAEREHFGPEERKAPVTRSPLMLGRRPSDLALAMARLRHDIARKGLERLERDPATPRAWMMAARHEVELARTEVRVVEGQEALTKLRGQHLRAEVWQKVEFARLNKRLLTLAFQDAHLRAQAGRATPEEVGRLKFALRQARDLADGLDLLNVTEETDTPVVRTSLDASAWLAHLDAHPRILRARQALELAELENDAKVRDNARAALQDAYARAEAEVRSHLGELTRHAAASREAAEEVAAAEAEITRMTRAGTADYTLERARLAAAESRANRDAANRALAEATLVLRLVLGNSGPETSRA